MASPHETESHAELAKVTLAWLGALLGSLTLNDLVLLATLVYTLVNTVVLVRERVLRRGPRPPCPPDRPAA